MVSKQTVEVVDLGVENRGIGDITHIPVQKFVHTA